jgi:O-antigen/teichoic acid export membrane protein
MVVETVFRWIPASVGSLVAQGDRSRSLGVFWELSLLSFGVYSVASLALVTCLNDLIALWLGSEYVLPDPVVWATVGNFYVYGSLHPVMVYRTGTGMFRETRYILVVTAILNICLSVALGSAYGIAGVLVATIIARLLTNAWFEPLTLLRRHLEGSFKRWVGWQGVFAAVVVAQAITYSRIPFQGLGWDPVPTFFAQGLTVGVLSCVVALLLVWRTESFHSLAGRFRLLIRESRG